MQTIKKIRYKKKLKKCRKESYGFFFQIKHDIIKITKELDSRYQDEITEIRTVLVHKLEWFK